MHHAGLESAEWFYNQVSVLDYDIIGLSYYPIWHGTSLSNLQTSMQDLIQIHNKDIVIAETAYPFTLQWNDNTTNIVGLETQLLENYEATESGQFLFLHDLITLVSENNFGLGICYWAPDWISTEQFGSPWT